MSKVCTRCQVEKPFSEFHKDKNRKDGHHYTCRVCCAASNKVMYWKDPEKTRARNRATYAANIEINRNKDRKYRVKNRNKINKYERKRYKQKQNEGTLIIGWLKLKYQGTPCMDCNGVFHWCAMDFDHRPEETKSFGIGSWSTRNVTTTRLAELEKEIAKCDIVCSNCHRVRTWITRKNND